MPKQQMVATGRQSKSQGNANRRPRPNTVQMRRDSATPGTNGAGPRLKLRVHPRRGDGLDQQGVATLTGLYPDEGGKQRSSDAMEEEEENELPVAQGARRSLRALKPARQADYLCGSDMEVDLSSVGKEDDEYTEAGQQAAPSSPRK
jgi:hypothetical protein